MGAHWQYFKYVCRHKWFVFRAGLVLGVPLWQLIVHDYTKFLLREWFPYVAFFYGKRDGQVGAGKTGYYHKPGTDDAFDAAWNHHQKRNPHHWQYWVLIRDNNDPKFLALPMPDRYVREMVADWIGAGRAQGNTDNWGWYDANKHKQIMHDETRVEVELLLAEATTKGLIPPPASREVQYGH